MSGEGSDLGNYCAEFITPGPTPVTQSYEGGNPELDASNGDSEDLGTLSIVTGKLPNPPGHGPPIRTRLYLGIETVELFFIGSCKYLTLLRPATSLWALSSFRGSPEKASPPYQRNLLIRLVMPCLTGRIHIHCTPRPWRH